MRDSRLTHMGILAHTKRKTGDVSDIRAGSGEGDGVWRV